MKNIMIFSFIVSFTYLFAQDAKLKGLLERSFYKPVMFPCEEGSDSDSQGKIFVCSPVYQYSDIYSTLRKQNGLKKEIIAYHNTELSSKTVQVKAVNNKDAMKKVKERLSETYLLGGSSGKYWYRSKNGKEISMKKPLQEDKLNWIRLPILNLNPYGEKEKQLQKEKGMNYKINGPRFDLKEIKCIEKGSF